jgi:hypothetical protein
MRQIAIISASAMTKRSGSLEVNRDFVLGRRMHPASTLPH